MVRLEALGVAAILDAMDGVAYLVDAHGTIIACGRRNWDEFARRNGGPALAGAPRPVGENLFSFIEGRDVAQSYRRFMEALIEGRAPSLVFAYRCDAPNVRRQMRMSMSLVAAGAGRGAVLYQSTTLSEDVRPPINILDPATMLAAVAADRDLPFAEICSFCHRVRLGTAEPWEWAPVEEYYRRGGPEKVRVSHGMCPPCAARGLDELRQPG